MADLAAPQVPWRCASAACKMQMQVQMRERLAESGSRPLPAAKGYGHGPEVLQELSQISLPTEVAKASPQPGLNRHLEKHDYQGQSSICPCTSCTLVRHVPNKEWQRTPACVGRRWKQHGRWFGRQTRRQPQGNPFGYRMRCLLLSATV